MNRIKYRLLLTAIIFMCAAPIAAFAQDDGGLDTLADGTAFDGEPSDDLPIDGGVSLLLAAGIGYGAKKLYDKRKGEGEGEAK